MLRWYAGLFAGLLSACGPPGPIPDPKYARTTESAHSAASLDGETLGADQQDPSERLASGARMRLQTSRKNPIVIDLAPGWHVEREARQAGLAAASGAR